MTDWSTPAWASTFSLSAPPASHAAGSMTAASPMNATIAVCQPLLVIKVCASGEAIISPTDPIADTAPMAALRLSGVTVCDVTVIAMFEVVQDSARPRHRPTLKMSSAAEAA